MSVHPPPTDVQLDWITSTLEKGGGRFSLTYEEGKQWVAQFQLGALAAAPLIGASAFGVDERPDVAVAKMLKDFHG